MHSGKVIICSEGRTYITDKLTEELLAQFEAPKTPELLLPNDSVLDPSELDDSPRIKHHGRYTKKKYKYKKRRN